MTTPSCTAWVELSGENPRLAEAELDGALRALGGRRGPSSGGPLLAGYAAVELETDELLAALPGRLALARRVLRPYPERTLTGLEARLRAEGAHGASAAFRPVAAVRGPIVSRSALRLADAYRTGGGAIRLDSPDRRFWVDERPDRALEVFEEIGAVDRRALERRRMPRLPYQRPVSLPPRLGRVAANLAAIRPGDAVVDPFVGTGALLLEAALLGARVSGVDRSVAMVRGALQNLASFSVHPERLDVADAAEAFGPPGGGGWAAVLTDPPYGRASGSGGESPEALVARVLPRWAERVRSGGRVVVVVPGGPDPLPEPWVRTVSVADRVHRSLTREFRVYERGSPAR